MNIKPNNIKLTKNIGNVKSLREFKHANMQEDNLNFANKKGFNNNSFSPQPIPSQQEQRHYR